MSYWKQVTEICRDKDAVNEPKSVLVFPFTGVGELLWVKHPVRGWEVPGGKIEPLETAVEAVHREVWEEAGAKLQNVHWIAEYGIHLTPSVLTYKWVYFADVAELAQRPCESEIVDVCTGPAPPPDEVLKDEMYSPVLKDAVYRRLWPEVQEKIRNGKQGSP